jgi:outer membrane protein
MYRKLKNPLFTVALVISCSINAADSPVAVANTGMSMADNLRDIYELALRNDPTIRAAEASYKAGLEAEKLGLSGLLPQINGSANLNMSDLSNDGGFAVGNEVFSNINDTRTDTQIWGVSLDQRVFDMPAWFGFTRGKELTRQAEAQFAADQQALIVRVAEDYFAVLRALDNLKASRAQEKANQRQLEQTQQRFDVGLIAITDVHEARAAYDLSVAVRLGDEGNLGVALERLSILTGQRHENIWILKEDYPVVNPDPMEKEEWVNFALNNNYTVKANAYARDAANEFAKSRKFEHAPKLTARLGYDDSTSDIERETNGLTSDYNQDFDGTSARLNLTLPIYSGGAISASRRQAYQEYNRAQELYAGAVRNTEQATRALHLQTTVDVATTNARRQAITSSRSAYDATQAGYEVGTRNIVDVLNVQQSLFSAVRDYANARYQYVIDMLKLKNQAGLISPQDVYTLNNWLVPPASPTLSDTGLNE